MTIKEQLEELGFFPEDSEDNETYTYMLEGKKINDYLYITVNFTNNIISKVILDNVSKEITLKSINSIEQIKSLIEVFKNGK